MSSQPWSTPSAPTRKLGHNASPRSMPRIEQPIRLIGDGPCVASTSHALDIQPICWDCNGFYRRLGLPPGAPRIEVARSFMDLDGHRSSALTNAARVLLNRVTKKAYDALPLGFLWPDDELLVQAVIGGDFEVTQPWGEWAFYVDEVDPTVVDNDMISLWRWMICFLLWRSGSPANRFAMGVSQGEINVSLVGFRIVVFVPVDSKPSWEYSSRIAQAVQRIHAGRT